MGNRKNRTKGINFMSKIMKDITTNNTRLDILKNSLIKKGTILDSKISNHFSTVALANGQPINDKRNAKAVFKMRNKQNDAIRTQFKEVEKTERAIEREENKIKNIEDYKEHLPSSIVEMIEKGILIQWRKYPRIFFVKGVDKARIFWNKEKKLVSYKFINELQTEQRHVFTNVYRSLYNEFNNNNQ